MAQFPTSDNSLIISSFNSTDKFHINSHFIKWIFEFIGIVNISDEVLNQISKNITFKIHSLLSLAKKFTLKSNRNNLTEIDLDNALINFGFEKCILNNNIYNYSSLIKISNRNINDIYFFCDDEMDIDEFISESRFKIRSLPDLCLKSHWLAINGVQPVIPENPQINDNNNIFEPIGNNFEFLPLSYHLQTYYKDLTEASIGTLEEKRKEALLMLQRDHSIKYLLVPLCSFIYQGIRVNIASRNLAILIYIMRMVCSIIQNPSIPPEMMESHFGELIPSILSCILSPDLCSKKFEENHWALRVYSAKLICNLCTNFDNFIPHLRGNVIELLNSAIRRSLEQIVVNESTLDITKNDLSFDLLEFPFGTFYGVFFTLSLMPRELMIINTLKYIKLVGKLFEALNYKLEDFSHEFLKRDVQKTEQQLIHNIHTFISDSEMANRSYLEEKIGKYLTEKLFKSISDINNKV